MKKIICHKGADGQWYITIKNARNGRTLGDGGEGYVSKRGGVRAIQNNWGDGYTFKRVTESPNSVEFRMIPHAQAPAR